MILTDRMCLKHGHALSLSRHNIFVCFCYLSLDEFEPKILQIAQKVSGDY